MYEKTNGILLPRNYLEFSLVKVMDSDPRRAQTEPARAQVREFELAYASIFFKNFLLREIHKANFRKDVIYIFKF